MHLAVLMAGGRPRHLRPGDRVTTGDLDGVIITGGHDVEPVLYKAEAEVEGRYDPERDAFESEVIDCALADSTPLLGICRGAQLLNVRLGGTLFQDLRSRRHRTSHRRTLLPLKTLCVGEATRLARLLGTVLADRALLQDMAGRARAAAVTDSTTRITAACEQAIAGRERPGEEK